MEKGKIFNLELPKLMARVSQAKFDKYLTEYPDKFTKMVNTKVDPPVVMYLDPAISADINEAVIAFAKMYKLPKQFSVMDNEFYVRVQ